MEKDPRKIPLNQAASLGDMMGMIEQNKELDAADEQSNKDYIGDGVYVIFDGNGISLHANDLHHPTDRIYLESSVLQALNRFAKRMGLE